MDVFLGWNGLDDGGATFIVTLASGYAPTA